MALWEPSLDPDYNDLPPGVFGDCEAISPATFRGPDSPSRQ